MADKIDLTTLMMDALERISGMQERAYEGFPSDWSEQIDACPECQRWKDHPIQQGICDEHRRPIRARNRHHKDERAALGGRMRRVASDALAVRRGNSPMADTENSTVYLANGQKAHVVSKVGDKHLVRAILTTEDEFQDEWPGGPLELVARIFDEPPVAAYDDRILERLRQLKKLSGELVKVRVELREAKRERERLLRYIERFVDGEVTRG